MKYYVSMTDKFLSGWGMAKGKINKLVFECENYEEAVIVRDNAENKADMKYINICTRKPYYNTRHYYPQYKDKKECGNWYKRGYFKQRRAS